MQEGAADVSMSTTRSRPGTTVHIGRRPVHDRDMCVVAHELHAADSEAPDEPGDVFVAGMIDVGLDRLSSGLDVVVALPDELVRGGGLAHLPLDRLVLDVRADHHPDEAVRTMLQSARRDGLRLRVADPLTHPHLAGIASPGDMLAVDVADLTPPRRRARLAGLRPLGGPVVATHVDDHATHDDCLAAGFDLFSGTVLSTPNVVAGRRLGADRVALLRLVALLDDPDVRVDDLEAAVAASPTLSYQVLRYVNSAHVGLRTEVDSVRRAVVLVGPPVLRHLAGLLLALHTDDKPAEAARVALSRAEACAVIGTALGEGSAGYRTVGLLSAVDLLMDVSLEDALSELPLSREVVDALLHHDGRLGRVLQAVRLYERCDWDDPVLTSFDPGLLAEAYLTGLGRADELLSVAADL